MKYETAKQLQEGFPLNRNWMVKDPEAFADIFLPELAPTLSELIEACGEEFDSLHQISNKGEKRWQADGIHKSMGTIFVYGATPEEAVAKIWLQLNKEEELLK